MGMLSAGLVVCLLWVIHDANSGAIDNQTNVDLTDVIQQQRDDTTRCFFHCKTITRMLQNLALKVAKLEESTASISDLETTVDDMQDTLVDLQDQIDDLEGGGPGEEVEPFYMVGSISASVSAVNIIPFTVTLTSHVGLDFIDGVLEDLLKGVFVATLTIYVDANTDVSVTLYQENEITNPHTTPILHVAHSSSGAITGNTGGKPTVTLTGEAFISAIEYDRIYVEVEIGEIMAGSTFSVLSVH